MDLREFTARLPTGGVASFAERVGVTRFYLSQLAQRQNGRQPAPALCVLIERESNFDVRRWDLRPGDWHLIWPELIKQRGAPPQPVTRHVEA
jgi:DNA-binding transcriptional regulator YdaS (Cro superfamily)